MQQICAAKRNDEVVQGGIVPILKKCSTAFTFQMEPTYLYRDYISNKT